MVATSNPSRLQSDQRDGEGAGGAGPSQGRPQEGVQCQVGGDVQHQFHGVVAPSAQADRGGQARQGQDPGQRGNPPRPAKTHLRRKTTRRWQDPRRLQHPKRIYTSLGPSVARRHANLCQNLDW